MAERWKTVWEKSVNANCDMALDFKNGSEEFSELISRNPKDGMIYYEFAEAFEYHEEWGLALQNYKKAKELFPREEWQEIAQAGIERTSIPKRMHGKTFATIYHNIHSLKLLNYHPSLKYTAIVAMGKSLGDKVISLLLARTIIETIVIETLYPNQDIVDEFKLDSEIKRLEQERKDLNKSIIEKMHNIRLAGNAVVHVRTNQFAKDLADNLEERMFDLHDVINEFYGNVK